MNFAELQPSGVTSQLSKRSSRLVLTHLALWETNDKVHGDEMLTPLDGTSLSFMYDIVHVTDPALIKIYCAAS